MLDVKQSKKLFTQGKNGLYLPKDSLISCSYEFERLPIEENSKLDYMIDSILPEQYIGVREVSFSRVRTLIHDMLTCEHWVHFYVDGLIDNSFDEICRQPVTYVGITQPKSQMNYQQLKIREVCDEMNEFGFSNVRTDTLRKKAIRTHKARLEELLEGYDVVMLKSSCKEMTTAVMKPSTYDEHFYREI